MVFSNIFLREGIMNVKHTVLFLFVLLFGVFLIGSAGPSAAAMADFACGNSGTTAKLQNGEYENKVSNFIILQDTSSSMAEKISDSANSKVQYSSALLKCLNDTLPDNFKVNAGLRNFGSLTTDVGRVYGMDPYSKENMAAAVNSITGTAGVTPIGKAINYGSMDIKDLTGKTAVLLFSDGINTAGTDPVAAAAAMKDTYGDNVCIYTVQLGADPMGQETLAKVADAGKCGFAINGSELGNAAAMEKFVTDVFLAKAPKKMAAPVMAPEPEVDSDGDGVPDSRDKCPDTPKGIRVDSDGCPIKIEQKISITLLIEFDFDKAVVKPIYHNDIEKVANFMKAYPDKNVELEGHTDSIGTDEYNKKLSIRRAESVKKYLVEKFGAPASRITTVGFGESKPVATNDTPEGRQKNRRVVALIETVVAK